MVHTLDIKVHLCLNDVMYIAARAEALCKRAIHKSGNSFLKGLWCNGNIVSLRFMWFMPLWVLEPYTIVVLRTCTRDVLMVLKGWNELSVSALWATFGGFWYWYRCSMKHGYHYRTKPQYRPIPSTDNGFGKRPFTDNGTGSDVLRVVIGFNINPLLDICLSFVRALMSF